MFVDCGIWCLADVSSVSPSSEQTAVGVCSDEGQTLEMSAKHHQGRIQGVASIAWDTVRFSDGRNNYFVY